MFLMPVPHRGNPYCAAQCSVQLGAGRSALVALREHQAQMVFSQAHAHPPAGSIHWVPCVTSTGGRGVGGMWERVSWATTPEGGLTLDQRNSHPVEMGTLGGAVGKGTLGPRTRALQGQESGRL